VIAESCLLSEAKRNLDFEPAKGSFWREAAVRGLGRTDVRGFAGPSVQHICNTVDLGY
jgi:hypothetical protein